ncbi:hypothetical protein [Streptomyces sp. NBC_01092]|uniref:hypothetical protein n=1 Tax=Streptomyces sp. NBC_01092 TaxID=2903748 RepID=UPI0038664B10|nr:hypothetical protein OG254_15755 [Streptomyces sp. NBC_01092]
MAELVDRAAGDACADEHLGCLGDGLTRQRKQLIIMCADHGDAFGEDGYHGRGIAHPTVLNVPFAARLMEPATTLTEHDPSPRQ